MGIPTTHNLVVSKLESPKKQGNGKQKVRSLLVIVNAAGGAAAGCYRQSCCQVTF